MALQREKWGAGITWRWAFTRGTCVYFEGVCCQTPAAPIAFTSVRADGKSAPHRIRLFSGKNSLMKCVLKAISGKSQNLSSEQRSNGDPFYQAFNPQTIAKRCLQLAMWTADMSV